MKSNYLRHFVTACICLSAALASRTAAAQSAAPCSLLTSAQVTEKTFAGDVWPIYRARSVTTVAFSQAFAMHYI
jgi:hypothetical protein